jgi:heme ABC exporter ATP-binding subunit CcmA
MIAARHIRRRFGRFTALEEVSLAVAAGQCLVLLGPNGAGKTTLLRILATLLRPSAGTLTLGGVDAVRDPEAARARIGLVGHGSQVYEDLTALENLAFWTAMRGGDARRERLLSALAQVDLDGVADERARTLSAGMKRRLALARLALAEPEVLLLDEPYTGLDQGGRKWLADFLIGRKVAGRTLVVATHSFTDALAIADRVGILAGGRLVLDRPSGDLTAEALFRLYRDLTGTEAEAA